jgi:hypothetical protein
MHALEDRVDRFLRRADPVGVFNPEQELPAMVTGEQPIEQRRARSTVVQKTSGGGGETRDDGL